MVKTRERDVLLPPPNKVSAIAHIVNDLGLWGAGFVVPLAEKYPKSKEMYTKLCKVVPTSLLLGQIQVCPVDTDVFVCNMFAMRGVRSAKNKVPLDYKLLEQCLTTLRSWAEKNLVEIVQVPKIGAGLAGGDWTRILEIIWKTFATSTTTIRICLQPQQGRT